MIRTYEEVYSNRWGLTNGAWRKRNIEKEGTGVFTWFHRVLIHQESGHSLIELLVVLTIIGTLIAIAIPRYMHLVSVARSIATS